MEEKTAIYLVTNKVNGKIYVGRTNATPVLRWKRHCWASKKKDTYLGRAIEKHGKDAFLIRTLEEVEHVDAFAREAWWIKHLRSHHVDIGYNLSWKSNGGSTVSKDTRALLSTASKKFWNSMSATERSDLRSQRMTGLVRTERHAGNISRAKAGRGHKTNQTSAFVGVSLHKGRRGRAPHWITTCYFRGRQTMRCMPDEITAAESYDRFALALHGADTPLNFPEKRDEYLKEDLVAFLNAGKRAKSKYRYVTYKEESRRWCVYFKGKFYGKVKTEEAAAAIAARVSGLALVELELACASKNKGRPRPATV